MTRQDGFLMLDQADEIKLVTISTHEGLGKLKISFYKNTAYIHAHLFVCVCAFIWQFQYLCTEIQLCWN